MSFAVLDVNHNNCQQQEKVKNNSPEPVKIFFSLKNVFSSNAGKISIQNPILYYAYSSVREQDDGANKRFLSCLMLCFRLIWGCMEIFLDCITLGLKIINFPCQ